MDCSEVQNTLLSSGWLSSLSMALSSHPGHAGLLEASLGIVRNLCRHSKYREDIVNLGFVAVAANAMKDFRDNPVLQKEACGVFGNLAGDAGIREQLGQSGVLQELVTTLQRCRLNDDRKVAKLALGALMNLSTSEANRELLAATDVVPVTLAAAQNFMQNENILEMAIGVISHMAVHATTGQQLAEAGGVEALLLFLQEHKEDLQVIQRSLVALRRLVKTSASSGNTVLLTQIACAGNSGGDNGIQLLVQAMEAHIYDETICKETALLFTSMADRQLSIQGLMTLAAEPCMKALELHQNDAPTSDALAGLLAHLPLEDDEEWSKAPQKVLSDSAIGLGAQAPRAGGYPM
jgi:hypothetical protein